MTKTIENTGMHDLRLFGRDVSASRARTPYPPPPPKNPAQRPILIPAAVSADSLAA